MLNAKPAETIRLVSGEDAAVVVVGSDEEKHFRSVGFSEPSEAPQDLESEKAEESKKEKTEEPKKHGSVRHK